MSAHHILFKKKFYLSYIYIYIPNDEIPRYKSLVKCVDLLSRIVGNVHKGVRLKFFLVTWLYFIGVASIGQWSCYEKIWYLHMHACKKANKYSAYAV